jgi:hypothetical protein
LRTLPVLAGDDDEAHVILFSGRDLWINGGFLYGGLLAAPGGFEQDGFMLKLLFSGGLYRYDAGDLDDAEVIGTEFLGAAMPGFRVKRGPVEMKFFFGPELQYNRLTPDDPGNRLRGRQLGLRFAAELWAEPTPSTMVAADASITSIGGNYAGRLAFGWRVFDLFYAGPETQVYGGDGYAQLRFGPVLGRKWHLRPNTASACTSPVSGPTISLSGRQPSAGRSTAMSDRAPTCGWG